MQKPLYPRLSEHNKHSQRELVAPLRSSDLALPAARRSTVLLKRVKWESAHASSRPRDRFVVVSLRKCLQRNLASTLQQDRGNPSLDGVNRLPDRKITIAAEQLVVWSTPTKPERLQRDYGFKFRQTSSMSRHWAARSRANNVVPLLWQWTQRCHPRFLRLLPFLNSAGVWGSHSSLLVVTEQVASPLCA